MTVPLEGKDSKIVISEMVIAGNIVTRRGISVARAIWFVCSKLLKIFFFNSRFIKEYFQGFSSSINLAVVCKGLVLLCLLFSLNKSCMHNIINVWGYTEILHNLRSVSAVFCLVKHFFSFDRNMGLNWPSFNFFHYVFEGARGAREADVETKLNIEAKHSVAIL